MITRDAVNVSVVFRALSIETRLGVALTTGSAGLSLWYMRDGEAPVTITPVDLATPQAAHVDYGIVHTGNGWHRLCLPDAACISGTAAFVLIGGGATGCIILSSKEDFETDTVSTSTITTTTIDPTAVGLPGLAGLLAAPEFTRTDEGAVKERSVRDLLAADAALKGIDSAGAVPWGLRIAKTVPCGTVSEGTVTD
jgi:hypothetical protein